MITHSKTYVTSDESMFATLNAAKSHELLLLLTDADNNSTTETVSNLCNRIVAKQDAVLAILKTRERKPRVRNVRKVKSKAAPKVAA